MLVLANRRWLQAQKVATMTDIENNRWRAYQWLTERWLRWGMVEERFFRSAAWYGLIPAPCNTIRCAALLTAYSFIQCCRLALHFTLRIVKIWAFSVSVFSVSVSLRGTTVLCWLSHFYCTARLYSACTKTRSCELNIRKKIMLNWEYFIPALN